MWKIQSSLAWLLDFCTKVLGNKEELRMFFGVKVQQRNWMFFWYNNRGEKTQLGIYKAICRGHTIPPFCQRLEGTTLKDSTNSTPTFLWIPKSSMFSERKDTNDICWGAFFWVSMKGMLGVTLDGWTFQSSKDGVYLEIKVLVVNTSWKITLPETNIAPENRFCQKESSLPTIKFQVLC